MTRHDRTWTTQPEAAALVSQLLDHAVSQVPEAEAFRARLREDIGVRLIDILDHLRVDAATTPRFRDAGWIADPSQAGVWRNPTGLFPAVVEDAGLTVAFKVEYVHEFVAAQQLSAPVEGARHAPFRRVRFAEAGAVRFEAIERRGSTRFDPEEVPSSVLRAARVHLQTFRSRRRAFDRVDAGFDYTDAIVAEAAAELGKDWACWLWCAPSESTGNCETMRVVSRRHGKMCTASDGPIRITTLTTVRARSFIAVLVCLKHWASNAVSCSMLGMLRGGARKFLNNRRSVR